MNIFIKRAAEYMGVREGDRLSKTDGKRLRAKAKKMKTSFKKALRKDDHVAL
jgi:hypothetical protein